MGAIQKIELTCDLCKWPATILDSEEHAKKEGWLTIGQDCYYADRSFFNSHVCPSCRKKIESALKKVQPSNSRDAAGE